MTTVYDDATEGNKESAEAKSCEGEGRRLYFRAVGELTVFGSPTNMPFLTTFVDLLLLFGPKTMLFDVPRHTVFA